MRSGTLDAPAIAGPRRGAHGVDGRPRRAGAARAPRCATTSCAGCSTGRRRHAQRRPRRLAARHRAPVVRGLRGRRAAPAARRRRDRVLARLGLLGRRAAAEPRAARDGDRAGRGPRLAAVLAGPHLAGRPTSTASSRCCRPSSPARRAGRVDEVRAMRVVAALSGGVDSAVAAARAVEAGHDVTGIHLALARDPQSHRTGARGCCTLEDARDARRVADVLGIPFYVWDLSERFAEDVDRRLRRRVRRRPHAQPVPALQRADQVLRRPRQGARARLRRRSHRPLRPARRRAAAVASCTGRSTPRRTSPTCSRVLDDAAARGRDVPARRLARRPRCATRPRGAGCSSPTSPTATTSASSPTATPRRGCATGSARRPATSSTPSRGRPSATTTAPTPSPWASAAACASAAPPPTAAAATSSASTLRDLDRARRPARAARGRPRRGRAPALVRAGARRPGRGSGAAARPRRAGRRRRRGRRRRSRPAGRRDAALAGPRRRARARRWCVYDGTRVVGSATITRSHPRLILRPRVSRT